MGGKALRCVRTVPVTANVAKRFIWQNGCRLSSNCRRFYFDCLGVVVLSMAMKEIDLLQGTLDLLVLKTLGAGPMHGYRIASKIHQLSADVLRILWGITPTDPVTFMVVTVALAALALVAARPEDRSDYCAADRVIDSPLS